MLGEERQRGRVCSKGVANGCRQIRLSSCPPGQQGATCQRQGCRSAGYKSVKKKDSETAIFKVGKQCCVVLSMQETQWEGSEPVQLYSLTCTRCISVSTAQQRRTGGSPKASVHETVLRQPGGCATGCPCESHCVASVPTRGRWKINFFEICKSEEREQSFLQCWAD